MTPVYHLDNPDERLQLALDQPTRRHRASIRDLVKRRYGDMAAQALIEGLHRAAKERLK